jgi:hypothetical protein
MSQAHYAISLGQVALSPLKLPEHQQHHPLNGFESDAVTDTLDRNNYVMVQVLQDETRMLKARVASSIGFSWVAVFRRSGKLLILRLTPRGLRRLRLELTRSCRISSRTAS